MRPLIAAVLAASIFACATPARALELETIAKAAAEYHNPNPRLEAMYRAALINTSQQATLANDGTAYVKTGDIPAEWLRAGPAVSLLRQERRASRRAAARHHLARG